MKFGFTKVALAAPYLRLGAPAQNSDAIIKAVAEAAKAGAEIIALPLLCISGGPADSMEQYAPLLGGCFDALAKIAAASTKHKSLVIPSLPVRLGKQIYTAVAFVANGKVLMLQTNYNGGVSPPSITIGGTETPVEYLPVINCVNLGARIMVITGEDFDNPPSCFAGNCANLIINIAASKAMLGSFAKRQSKIINASERLTCAYAYISGGQGMSVSGSVYSGDKIAAQNGKLLAKSTGENDTIIYADFDLEYIDNMRISPNFNDSNIYHMASTLIPVDIPHGTGKISRPISRLPYVPADPTEFDNVVDILARGVKGRMEHIGVGKVIFGLSGGLDSAMTLRICVHMADKYKINRDNIICVTMSGAASSTRTASNAQKLIKLYGVRGIDIPIAEAVTQHLEDIGHKSTTDIVFENAQARERTQILLNLANKYGALVLGTGDLSEIALGWSTFGGDQLAQYNPNSSLAKTFIRAALRYYALNLADRDVAEVMTDILATPISPELTKNQDTEKELGPYELHDFFLHNLIGKGFNCAKTLYMTGLAFPEYSAVVTRQTLRKFITRFFSHQFKRLFGCDGIQITPYDLSNLYIKTDFSGEQWLAELDAIEAAAAKK